MHLSAIKARYLTSLHLNQPFKDAKLAEGEAKLRTSQLFITLSASSECVEYLGDLGRSLLASTARRDEK